MRTAAWILAVWLALAASGPAEPTAPDHRESLRRSLREELSPRLLQRFEPLLTDRWDADFLKLTPEERQQLERLFTTTLRELKVRESSETHTTP